jgi:trans-2,3-dihydro-3-hydroxyanthranilate isomerase
MFAPALGVREDAATGSAAGPLALHLARHGWVGFGEEIEIHQGAEIARPSVLYARANGTSEEPTEISLAGAALVVAKGSYYLN